jgi:hypothetical protein
MKATDDPRSMQRRAAEMARALCDELDHPGAAKLLLTALNAVRAAHKEAATGHRVSTARPTGKPGERPTRRAL